MSVFYVLPPRPLVGDHLARSLGSLFPGLDWDRQARLSLTNALTEAVCPVESYVVFREELPGGELTHQALIDGFGAEEGDEVIEVRAGSRPGELVAQRWPVRAA